MLILHQDIHENLLGDEDSFNHEPEPLSFKKKMLVIVSVLSISGALVLSSALQSSLHASMDHASVSRIGGGPNMHMLKNRNMDKKKSDRHYDVNHHNHRHHRGRRFYLRHRTRMQKKNKARMKSQVGRNIEDFDDDDKDDVFQGSYYKYDDEFHEPIASTHAQTNMQTYTYEHHEKLGQNHDGHTTESQSYSSSSENEGKEQ